jgi:hypothetical protein
MSAGPAIPASLADAGGGVTDAGLGRAIVFGLTVGTLAMYLVAFGICLAAGLTAGRAAGVAVIPGVFSGVFGGGSPALLRQMLRFEKEQRRLHS